ncbi:hypothetical protein R50076_06290 [Gilvimarinus japonicus]
MRGLRYKKSDLITEVAFGMIQMRSLERGYTKWLQCVDNLVQGAAGAHSGGNFGVVRLVVTTDVDRAALSIV